MGCDFNDYEENSEEDDELNTNGPNQRIVGDQIQSITTFLTQSSKAPRKIEAIKRLKKIRGNSWDFYIKNLSFVYELKDGSFYETEVFGTPNDWCPQPSCIQKDEFELDGHDSVDSVIVGFREGVKYFKVVTTFNNVYTFGESTFDLRTRMLEVNIGKRQ